MSSDLIAFRMAAEKEANTDAAEDVGKGRDVFTACRSTNGRNHSRNQGGCFPKAKNKLTSDPAVVLLAIHTTERHSLVCVFCCIGHCS